MMKDRTYEEKMDRAPHHRAAISAMEEAKRRVDVKIWELREESIALSSAIKNEEAEEIIKELSPVYQSIEKKTARDTYVATLHWVQTYEGKEKLDGMRREKTPVLKRISAMDQAVPIDTERDPEPVGISKEYRVYLNAYERIETAIKSSISECEINWDPDARRRLQDLQEALKYYLPSRRLYGKEKKETL